MKHATDEKLKTNPSMSKNELASSRDKFRTLFESSPIDMVLMDLEGNIIDINDAGVELHGYSSRNELIGKNCFLLVDEEYREEAKIKWLEAISLGHVKDFELALLKKDGQKFSTLVNASCLRNSSGESYAMLAIVMDISERKKVEAALRRSERSIRENKDKFKALIETNVDFIWEMDEKGKYTYCSPQMEKLWNLKPGEMLGKSPFDILPLDMRETAENIFFRLIENPQPFNNLEAISLDGKGNLINIEISGVPFYDEMKHLIKRRHQTCMLPNHIKKQRCLNT